MTLRAQVVMIVLGMATLVTGLWGGLLRMGWGLPPATNLAADHGPLMVGGFLGILVGLERAAALRVAWAYAAPAACVLGTLSLIAGLPVAPLFFVIGALVLTIIGVAIYRIHPTLETGLVGVAGAAWLAGNGIWLFGSVPEAVFWWIAFLVIIICGERLELSRIIRLSRTAQRLFLICLGIVLAGVALRPLAPDWGARLAGLGMLTLAAWLARYDLARRTIRLRGQTRFIAASLLSGYFWLAASGAIVIVVGDVAGGFFYDAVLHSLFVGFVFSMVFGHATIILPALGVPVRYTPRLYASLVLLHASLVIRIAGDLAALRPVQQLGGLLNALVVLTFALTMMTAIVAGRKAALQSRHVA